MDIILLAKYNETSLPPRYYSLKLVIIHLLYLFIRGVYPVHLPSRQLMAQLYASSSGLYPRTYQLSTYPGLARTPTYATCKNFVATSNKNNKNNNNNNKNNNNK